MLEPKVSKSEGRHSKR